MEHLRPQSDLEYVNMKRVVSSLSVMLVLLGFIALAFTKNSYAPKQFNSFFKISSNQKLENFRQELNSLDTIAIENTTQIDSLFTQSADMMRLVPASELPLIHKATVLVHQKKYPEAIKLLELAQQKNPRSRYAARGLFYLTLSQQQFDPAMKQLDLLFRLNKDKTDEYINYLSQISDAPTTKSALVASLIKHPFWGEEFVKRKIAQSNDFDQLTELVSYWAKSFSSLESTKSEQQPLIQKMRKARNYEAIQRFKEKLFSGSNRSTTGIHDSEFEGLYAPKPLTWTLAPSGQNYAEMSENGGLNVGSKGTKKTTLASQLFFLPEGERFELNIHSQGRFTDKKARFRWELLCLPSEDVIGEINISALFNRTEILKLEFSKPSLNCEAQELKLIALTSDKLERIKMQVEEIKIIPLPVSPNNELENVGTIDE